MAEKKWRRMFRRAAECLQKGRGYVYDAVKLLVQISQDPQFGPDMQADGVLPYDHINRLLGSTVAICFLNLQGMLKMFPAREQWESGHLSKMETQFLASTAPKKERKEDPNRDTRLSWKEQALDRERENAVLRAQVLELKAQVRLLEKKNKELLNLIEKELAQA